MLICSCNRFRRALRDARGEGVGWRKGNFGSLGNFGAVVWLWRPTQSKSRSQDSELILLLHTCSVRMLPYCKNLGPRFTSLLEYNWNIIGDTG